MLRRLSLLLTLFCLAPALHAEAPARLRPQPMSGALHAMQDGRWDRAADLARRAGPAGEALIEWQRLRAGLGAPQEVLAFLATYPDWPGLERLRRESEAAMAAGTDAQILAFFRNARPQTGTGALALARALTASGQQGDAEAGLVLAWRTLDLDPAEHAAFLALHGPLLAPHHAARLDMTLWRGLRDSAAMLPLVTSDQRKVAEMRQMLEDGSNGLDAALAALPEALRDDPGIAYGRFNRFLKVDAPDKAMALMLSQSRIAGGLGEPERWASWRRALARRMMREGDASMAYELAANHQLSEGESYADLEWLSGYIALRFLDDPDLALDHFQRLRAGVASPISLGRAGYWIGRAQEAMGDAEGAQIAYAQAAEHQTAFYGLLAAERAGLPADPALAGAEVFASWRQAAFAGTMLNQAAVLMLAEGDLNLAELLFMALAATLDRTGLGQMGAMFEDLGQPHLQVMLGKQAAQRGIVLPRHYYPLHPMAEMDLPVPMEMALAIARRESEFDHRVVSGAGAEGLMQVMPGTASDVARDLGLDFERGRVRSDWAYNARLGSEYLAQLSRKFGANVVMMAAGYNAGPRRPEDWMQQFGDPRSGDIDVVDWIETIPFRETRNYVQRVAESLPVYRARLGRDPHPVPFSRELIGATIPILKPTAD